MQAARDALRAGSFDASARYHWRAWQQASERDQQATTLHHCAVRLLEQGDPDGAASYLEVARALRRGFADPRLVTSTEAQLARARQLADFDAVILAGGSGRI